MHQNNVNWRHSDVFIVNFKCISPLFLVCLLPILNRLIPTGRDFIVILTSLWHLQWSCLWTNVTKNFVFDVVGFLSDYICTRHKKSRSISVINGKRRYLSCNFEGTCVFFPFHRTTHFKDLANFFLLVYNIRKAVEIRNMAVKLEALNIISFKTMDIDNIKQRRSRLF